LDAVEVGVQVELRCHVLSPCAPGVTPRQPGLRRRNCCSVTVLPHCVPASSCVS
jgi:ribosomal protein S6E (S10)